MEEDRSSRDGDPAAHETEPEEAPQEGLVFAPLGSEETPGAADETRSAVSRTREQNCFPSILQAIGLLAGLLVISQIVVVAILLPQIGSLVPGQMPDLAVLARPQFLVVANSLSFGLVLLLGLRLTRARFGEVFSLAPIRAGLLLPMAVTVLGAQALLSEADNLLRLYLPPPAEVTEIMRTLIGDGKHLWWPFMGLVVVAPITEELLFRGLMLRGFLKRYSPAKAVLVSAVLFGAFHLNPWQFVGAAVLGTLFGWWYVQTRSLVPCLFGHALSNSLPLLLVAVAGPSAPGLTDLTGEVRFQPLWVDALAVVLVAVGIRALHRAFAAAKAEPPAETPEDAWA